MRHLSQLLIAATLFLISTAPALAQELIIGERIVEPGIHFIFEGAVKDDVNPYGINLEESRTDVHIEARVNWASDPAVEVPEGTPRGGFVPYLNLNAEIINEKTGKLVKVDLLPHINLVDNFHYARNIDLPGERDELYTVRFVLQPPSSYQLSTHLDWRETYGNQLFEGVIAEYTGVDFEEIANATRR